MRGREEVRLGLYIGRKSKAQRGDEVDQWNAHPGHGYPKSLKKGIWTSVACENPVCSNTQTKTARRNLRSAAPQAHGTAQERGLHLREKEH